MKINEMFGSMLEHPFATVIVIGSIMEGAARVIAAANGNKVEPHTVIEIGKQPESK